jgi:biopolymer transport protein ExbD
MRFKSQQKRSEMPEINLVPMMDVLMTVLTFFIIVSMTLTGGQNGVNVTLPSAGKGVSQQKTPNALVVVLDSKEQLFLDNQQISEEQLSEPVKAYLQQHPDGAVILKADRQLSYEKVVQLLGKMRDIGGDRVSLAIDSQS